MIHEPEKPMTHIAWTPYFDEDGNFVRSVEIGHGFIEKNANGVVTGHMFRDREPIGYDSRFVWLMPNGQQPPLPPPEIIAAARFDAEQRNSEDALCAAEIELNAPRASSPG